MFAADLGQTVPPPYGAFYLEAMDAHGGWLASAEDLARFAAALDDLDHCPILNRTSIEQMIARPPVGLGTTRTANPKQFYYSLGWLNRTLNDGSRINHWHNGSLPGTLAILIRRHDRRNMVALLNTRSSPQTDDLPLAVDRVLHQAADKIEPCPGHRPVSGRPITRMTIRFLLTFVCVLTMLLAQDAPAAEPRPIVIAHRGASGYLPEHTLAAKALAYGQGADFLEQDVVLTKDDQPIVLHDIQLDAVTNVAQAFPDRARQDGRYYAIDLTLAEIQSLRVTERMDWRTNRPVFPGRFPPGKSDFRVPTLAEEIELIQGLNHSTGRTWGSTRRSKLRLGITSRARTSAAS